MIRIGRTFWFLALCALPACSAAYAFKSARGHFRLLCSRRPIEKILADPGADPDLKRKLALAVAARAYGFESLGLKRSRDYSTYAPVGAEALTWTVSASERLRLKIYEWSFPFIGRFPYKGFFDKADADKEAAALTARGFDAYVGAVAAYNTPLWISDPLPQTLLRYSTGSLCALILHELAHGTVFYKNRMEFNEALATFVGEQGALEFLEKRFGGKSPELAAYRQHLAQAEALGAEMERIYDELQGLYASALTDDEKMVRRQAVFKRAEKRLAAMGWNLASLNNAAVLAHRVYRGEVDVVRRVFEKSGRDWKVFFSVVGALDKHDPVADLRRRF